MTCPECGRDRPLDTRCGLCFGCRVRTVGFTFRGAHPGRAGWNEDTVMGTKREIYEAAREGGYDITRA